MNKKDYLFVDSEYLFMIQSFNIKLERVIKRGYSKLYFIEVSDVRLGRSKNQFIQSISPSICNEQESLSLPSSANSPSLMDFKCGRSIIHLFKSIKYLILLLIKIVQMHYFPIQWNSIVEDLFISNIISIIPFITNEEQ